MAVSNAGFRIIEETPPARNLLRSCAKDSGSVLFKRSAMLRATGVPSNSGLLLG